MLRPDDQRVRKAPIAQGRQPSHELDADRDAGEIVIAAERMAIVRVQDDRVIGSPRQRVLEHLHRAVFESCAQLHAVLTLRQ